MTKSGSGHSKLGDPSDAVLAVMKGLLIIMLIRAMKSNCPNVSPNIILDVPLMIHLVYCI